MTARGRLGLAAAAALLALSAGLLVYGAWADSLTYDEARYMRAGYCALTHGVVDIEPTNPAGYKLLSGIGLVLAQPAAPIDCAGTDRTAFFATDPAGLRRLILAGRLPMVVVALLLELVVYTWARALYGAGAGLLALAAAGLEPTLLAHGHLATGDTLVAAGTLTCLAAIWAHRRRGGRGWLLLASAGLGLALLAKVSALLLLPVLGAVILLDGDAPRRGRWRGLGALSAVVALAWFTVCLAYAFFHTDHTPLHLAAPLAWLAPPSWLYGVGYQAGHVAQGAYGYLNGEVRVGHGFLTYYLEALGLKSTLGFLALAGLALFAAVRRRDRAAALYLWLPAAGLVAAASLNAIDIGVRYVLPVYALLAVAAGGLMAAGNARWVRRAAVAGGVLLALASGLHAPNQLGYFNELAGSRPERFLADSNLDWGQDAWRLRDAWLAAGRPRLVTAYFGALPLSAYGVTDEPVQLSAPPPAEGSVAVSLTQLLVYGADADPAWRSLLNCAPATRVGTSILWGGAPRRDGSLCALVALR